MKILYVGELSDGATAQMRMSHLSKLGHPVEAIATGDDRPRGHALTTLSRVAWRCGWPLDLSSVNRRMIEGAHRFAPDVVWVDKGTVVRRSTLTMLRRLLPDVRLIHYNPDDPFGLSGQAGWRRFIHAMPYYDMHFVPRRENVLEYRKRGCQNVIHNIPTRGFDPDVHQPYARNDDMSKIFSCDVGFLGAYEKQRYVSLCRLASAGVPIRLMIDWPKQYWHGNFRRATHEARGATYARALSSFKIGLGFLRKANRDQHTSRSIEVPACGTFLLAERTDEHQMLFEEGKEAEFFSFDEELIDKVRFYLKSDSAREAIARAGRERCVRSGYDYGSRMKQMLQQAMALGH